MGCNAVVVSSIESVVCAERETTDVCRCEIFSVRTFSLLGEKGGGLCSLGPEGPYARRESLEASFARRSRMARFTPFTEAMEMRSAWCDTNERREWGGYAVRSTPER